MLWHYFISALLAIKAQGKYTLINILGLTTGLCAALLLLMIIVSDTGFDRHHPQFERLVRVEVVFDSLDNTHMASVAGAMGPTLKQLGIVEDSVRLLRQDTKLRIGPRQYVESGFVYADASAAELLQFDVIAGDLNQALSRPFGLALTETTAKRWFGKVQVLNEVVMTDAGDLFQVLAVIEDLPRQTHFDIDMLTSMKTLESIEGESRLENWMRNDFYTYVLLPQYRQLKELEHAVTEQLSLPLLQIVPGLKLHFELQPIAKIHLNSHALNEFKVNGDITQVRVFGCLIAVILFVAIFNYINFATATAGRRAKEIGVRQVVGASRRSMIFQFMCESFLLVSIAFLLALVVVIVSIPWVNHAFSQDLQIQMLFQKRWISWAFMLFIGVVIGAGTYPALVLSSIPTLSALKGAGFKGASGHWFRRIVLFLQLSSAICLAILGGNIYAQMSLIESTPLGYNKQDKLILTNVDSNMLMTSLPALKQYLQGQNHIHSVAAAEFIPTQDHGNLVALRSATEPRLTIDNVVINTVSADFFHTLGIKVLVGRDFYKEEDPESSIEKSRSVAIPIIINRSTLAYLNLGKPSEAIGQQIELGWDPDYEQVSLGHIIAVVDDYFTTSLKVDKRPMVFITGEMNQGKAQLIVSFSQGGYLIALSQLRTLWPMLFSENLPSYQLLISRFEGLYRQDKLRGTMVNLFNVLTLVVITFGVLGLCSFSAQRRLKEFALRQLMGANTASLGWILGREFLVLVFVAWVAMLMPAWWLTEQWLAQFVTRVDLQWWLYILTPLMLVLIIVTVVVATLTMLRHMNLSKILSTE
jgi:putative ABC transport system permease protein